MSAPVEITQSLWEMYGWGTFGGLFAEVIELKKMYSNKPKAFKKCLTDPFYYGVTLALILLGGFIVLAYIKSDVSMTVLLAINVGLTAPLVFSKGTAKEADILD